MKQKLDRAEVKFKTAIMPSHSVGYLLEVYNTLTSSISGNSHRAPQSVIINILPIYILRNDEGNSTEARLHRIQANEALDIKYGFERHKDTTQKLGWLINLHPVSGLLQVSLTLLHVNINQCWSSLQTEIVDDDKKLISAVDLYFLQEDGARFRVS